MKTALRAALLAAALLTVAQPVARMVDAGFFASEAMAGPAILGKHGQVRLTKFIRGRLVCAVNVGRWLKAHGRRSTGSAAAASYLRFKRIPKSAARHGDVRYNTRKGGGHVMIVIGGGKCLNPSSARQRWVIRTCPPGGIYVRP